MQQACLMAISKGLIQHVALAASNISIGTSLKDYQSFENLKAHVKQP